MCLFNGVTERYLTNEQAKKSIAFLLNKTILAHTQMRPKDYA